jgi:S-DNA-T family DNA segregation ATPase FtsK/SpoIIIE
MTGIPVVARGPRGELEVEVTARGDATVRDLSSALGQNLSYADDARLDPDATLDDQPVPRGAVLAPAPPDAPAEICATAEVRVIAGLHAGLRQPLGAGRHTVGREHAFGVDVALGNNTVSLVHAAVTINASGKASIEDLQSRNGTRVGQSFIGVEGPSAIAPLDHVDLGAVRLTITAPARDDRPALDRPDRTGLVTFNRQPRAAVVRRSEPLRTPTPVTDSPGVMPFRWAACFAPLVLGGVLVVVTRNLLFAGFLLLSPLMAVATWWEERRRRAKQRRAGLLRHDEAVERFTHELAEAGRRQVVARRAAVPDLAEIHRRATTPSARLWERRPAHEDFGVVGLGFADLPWAPPLDRPTDDPVVRRVLDDHAQLVSVPLAATLTAGSCLGVVGPRDAALALVRGVLCQSAVHSGPADLAVAILCDRAAASDWDWAKWLPHTVAGDRRLLAATGPETADLLAHLLTVDEGGAPDLLHLVVLDVDGVTHGRDSAARDVLAGHGRAVAGIVLADRADRLPATCTAIVTLIGPDGLASYAEPRSGLVVDEFLAAGLPDGRAREIARSLARYDDAELRSAGGRLPDQVLLPSLLDVALEPGALAARWQGTPAGSLAAVVGAGVDGPLVIDLVTDGPHGLIAGTTGSGKSELLRTIVASLAATVSPADLNFVLVDYKGGSAFAECARLPHTVGLVTDLDEHLGARALVCLEAELRHRERLLRDAGTADLDTYVAAGRPLGALPRLLVVIDEFATLAAELPDFIDSLVGIAQRGRSLGVHLLLATQRPAGAVKDNIRANTNLRIALRVQDSHDSLDVLGSPVASTLSRRQPGRAFVRLGPGEVTAFQSALVTGASAPAEDVPAVTVTPFTFGPGHAALPPPSVNAQDSDLARLVDAACDAAQTLQLPAPRSPWPAPLPDEVTLTELPAYDGGELWSAPIGLADDPARQQRRTRAWRADDGSLLIYGVAGSGTSTALVTLGLSLAERYSPAELHLYALDFGSSALAPLAALPQVGAVVSPAERERVERLVGMLRDEVARRRALFRETGASSIAGYRRLAGVRDQLPGVVLLVDGWGALHAALDDVPGLAVRDDLTRVVADGPGLGIYVIGTADRPMAVPAAVATLVPEKLALRLSDRHDYGFFGLSARDVPDLPPGRALSSTSRLEIQLARPGEPVGEAVRRIAARTAPVPDARAPRPVGTMPEDVSLAEIAGVAALLTDDWWLPVGIGERSLQPAGLHLADGEHVLVAGAARSGRSTLLASAVALVRAQRPDVGITVICTRRSPLRELAGVRLVTDLLDIEPAVDAIATADGPQLLVVDDAETVDDQSGRLVALLKERRSGLRVIASGRADALRTAYGHWTGELRRSRTGVLLKPRDGDGDLWSTSLPRHAPARFPVGRGYLLCDGDVELVQVAA